MSTLPLLLSSIRVTLDAPVPLRVRLPTVAQQILEGPAICSTPPMLAWLPGLAVAVHETFEVEFAVAGL